MDASSGPREPLAPASKILERAQELIERGWCQHGFTPGVDMVSGVDPDADAFCVQGAVIASLMEHGFNTDAHTVWGEDAMTYLEKEVMDSTSEFHSEAWNDDPNREKGEVLDLLGYAIKRAKEDESLV